MMIFYEERICYLSPNFIVTTLPTTFMGPLCYCSVLFAPNLPNEADATIPFYNTWPDRDALLIFCFYHVV